MKTLLEKSKDCAECTAEFMSGVLDSLQTNIVMCDPALRIVTINASALKTLRGLSAEIKKGFDADVEQLIGVSAYRFVADPARAQAILSDPSLLPHVVEVPVGAAVFRASIDALRAPQQAIAGYAVVFEDVTPLRAAERDSRAALLQRETLQREVSRRVKKSLQTVADLVRLENDVPAGEALAPAWSPSWVERLNSLSIVHELVYAAEDVSRVDLDAYVKELVRGVVAKHAEPGAKIKTETAVSADIRDLDLLISFGMVLKELVANAIKHAFPGGRAGRIRVTARNVDGAVEAVVSDDGAGMRGGHSPRTGFGLKLAAALVKTELKGKFKIESRGGGTTCVFSIPVPAP
jgi:two-component sensor histidine kinase